MDYLNNYIKTTTTNITSGEFYLLLNFLVLMIVPFLVIIGFQIYQYKKNISRHIFIETNLPNGMQRQISVKMGVSWTIFFFYQWALLFRFQFVEFMITLLISLTLNIIFSLTIPTMTIDQNVFVNFASFEWWNYLILVLISLVTLSVKIYLMIFGNQRRMVKMMRQGFKVSENNSDIEQIEKYINSSFKDFNKPLEKDQVQGATHRYVVPNVEEKIKEDEPDDYSNLTINDLRLLLRMDGIHYSNDMGKEELLKLVEKNIKKTKPKKEIIKEEVKKDVNDIKEIKISKNTKTIEIKTKENKDVKVKEIKVETKTKKPNDTKKDKKGETKNDKK